MEFFQINIKITGLGVSDNRPNKTPPSAYLEQGMVGWELVHGDVNPKDPEANIGKIYDRQMLDNVPVFDYFILKEMYADHKKRYDWILLDVYNMASGRDFLLKVNNTSFNF